MEEVAGKPIRLLVCGSREWWDDELLANVLEGRWFTPMVQVLIEGEAPGADSMAKWWARNRRIEVLSFPADWAKYGKAAGAIRNQQMIDEGEPTLVIAFHDDLHNSKGTKDMVKRAQKNGILVELYSHQFPDGVVPNELR